MFYAAAGGGSEDYSIMVQGLGRMFMGKDWENVHEGKGWEKIHWVKIGSMFMW